MTTSPEPELSWLPKDAVLAAIEPSGHDGTPTYLVRNRLAPAHGSGLTVSFVRRVLLSLERQGRVHRTAWSRPNQVHWKSGSKA